MSLNKPSQNPSVFSTKKVLQYLYDKLTGTFMGFLIGMSASGLVSRFFETRSFKNLWGIAAKKTLVDKNTFSALEWIISIIIGFLVFEVMTKVVKKNLDQHLPSYKFRLFRWMVRNDYHTVIKLTHLRLSRERVALFTDVHHGTKNAFTRITKR